MNIIQNSNINTVKFNNSVDSKEENSNIKFIQNSNINTVKFNNSVDSKEENSNIKFIQNSNIKFNNSVDSKEENSNIKFNNTSEAGEDCSICFEEFTKSRKKICCIKCNNVSCVNCIKEHLLISDTLDPKCPDCECSWSLEFISTNTPKSFHNYEYRNKQTNLLLNVEKSLLPSTQSAALHIKRLKTNKELIILEEKQIDFFHLQIKNKKNYINFLRYGGDPQSFDNSIHYNNANIIKPELQNYSANLIQKCPNNDCLGFISDISLQCDLCLTKICKDCNIMIINDNEHKCNQNDIDSFVLIKKEVKTCPTCSVPIYRISGCSQMFCTYCKNSFSWITGKKIFGEIHNPHFFKWQQQLFSDNSQDAIRNRCGLLPPSEWFFLFLESQFSDDIIIIDQFKNFFRLIRNIRNWEIPTNCSYIFNEETNKDLRIKFILKEIDEKEFLSLIKRRKKRSEKEKAIREIWQTFMTISIEIINTLSINEENYEIRLNKATNFLEKINQLIDLVNNEFHKVSKRFSNKTPLIFDFNIL